MEVRPPWRAGRPARWRRYLRVHHRGSVHGRLQGVSGQRAGVRLGGLQARDGGVSARELGGQRRSGDGPQESVGHLGVHLQRRDPRRYVQGALVHRRLEAVVGGHRGQRGVVGRGDGTVHGRCGAVVGQLQVRGALCGNHALQHVEGRLVCLVGEARGQRALQHGDAASVRGHLPVRGGQGRRRGKRRNTRSSSDWMAAALLPAAAVFTARSVT